MPLKLTLALLWPAAAHAQPAHLDPLIDQLDSELLEVREAASLRIPRIPGLSVRDIEGAMAATELSPEQRLRLGRIAQRLFASTPRAGLGVRFAMETPNAVTLAGVVEGGQFPAAAMLAAGDAFLDVDGVSPVSQTWLKAWIISHAPGETLHITLNRDGQVLELDVPLGSFNDLGNAASLDAASIAQAYRLRRERMNADDDTPQGLGRSLDATDWINAAYPQRSFTTDPRPIAVLSGHWVAGVSDSINRAMGWGSRSLHLLHPMALTGEGFPGVLPDDLRADMRSRLQRQQETLLRRADQLEELLARREYTPNEIENIRQQVAAARSLAQTTGQTLAELEAVPSPGAQPEPGTPSEPEPNQGEP
ncbi:MAG: hypothetical protein ACI89L_000757 [Phycisphaerales bacterium]|jgi:hypothetical protein